MAISKFLLVTMVLISLLVFRPVEANGNGDGDNLAVYFFKFEYLIYYRNKIKISYKCYM